MASKPSTTPVSVRREMGYTRTELVTAVRALANSPVRFVADAMIIDIDGGTVRIAMHQSAPRRIGALAVPVLHVELSFEEVSETARQLFLQRFELYTRRGGG